MASYNKVILMGNLTRDPEIRATGTTGMKVARLGIAINERRRDKNGQTIDAPIFIDVDAWDRLAELCGQFLTKGRSVLVEGRLQMDTWERDGIRHQKLKVRATAIKFLPIPDRSGAGMSQRPPMGDVPQGESRGFTIPQRGNDSLESDPDDIPF